MTMIRKIARALVNGDPDAMVPKMIIHTMPDGGRQVTLSQTEFEPAWTREIDRAKACLSAMREPTEGMVKAAYGERDVDAWRTMIDVALAEMGSCP